MAQKRRIADRGSSVGSEGFMIVLSFIFLALLISSPFIYRAFRIHEIYVYPDVRGNVLDSIFFLREEYGLTIADLTVTDVVLEGDVIHITIHEEYHGLIDRSKHDDLIRDYRVDYSYADDSFVLVGVDDGA